MKLTPLIRPEVGKLIFSPSWNLLCTIKTIYASGSGFRFYVHNGDWYGQNHESQSIIEIRTYKIEEDEVREKIEDFQEVLEISSEEAGNYYYRG